MGRPRVYKPCPECGEPFYGGRKYCSDKCTKKAGKSIPKRTGANVECIVCGVEFYLPQNRLKRTKHYTCSIEHQIEWQSRNKVKRTCDTCDGVFYVSPSRVKFDAARFCSMECKEAHPDTTQHLLNINQKQQVMEQSSIETIGYSLLDTIGIDYEMQYMIDDKFCVDAYIPSKKLIIQFDGDYWHAHPDKYKELDKRQKKRVQTDKSQNAYFKKYGYNILRFWGSELREQPEQIISKIRTMI